jgi:hypothetical protein
MGLKKRVLLDLHAKVKVIEVSEKDKLTVKQIVGKFKTGKTQVYDIFKSKSDVKHKWLTGNGSMKRKLKETGNKDINGIAWDWFVSVRAKKFSVSGPMLQQKAETVAEWSEKLCALMDGYEPKDIANCDETGLFFQALPNKTLFES